MRTPEENEQFVREHWANVALEDHRECCGRFDPFRVVIDSKELWHGPWCAYLEEAWAAAAEFTEHRMEEIRQVEMEIALLRGLLFLLSAEPGDLTAPIWERVIVREQAALESLKKGMRL